MKFLSKIFETDLNDLYSSALWSETFQWLKCRKGERITGNRMPGRNCFYFCAGQFVTFPQVCKQPESSTARTAEAHRFGRERKTRHEYLYGTPSQMQKNCRHFEGPSVDQIGTCLQMNGIAQSKARCGRRCIGVIEASPRMGDNFLGGWYGKLPGNKSAGPQGGDNFPK